MCRDISRCVACFFLTVSIGISNSAIAQNTPNAPLSIDFVEHDGEIYSFEKVMEADGRILEVVREGDGTKISARKIPVRKKAGLLTKRLKKVMAGGKKNTKHPVIISVKSDSEKRDLAAETVLVDVYENGVPHIEINDVLGTREYSTALSITGESYILQRWCRAADGWRFRSNRSTHLYRK